MERVMNENKIYRAAIYCRLSKDDELIGESVSIETQKMLLTEYCVERGYLDHFNIEIQVMTPAGKWKSKWSYHIIFDGSGMVIEAFD